MNLVSCIERANINYVLVSWYSLYNLGMYEKIMNWLYIIYIYVHIIGEIYFEEKKSYSKWGSIWKICRYVDDVNIVTPVWLHDHMSTRLVFFFEKESKYNYKSTRLV